MLVHGDGKPGALPAEEEIAVPRHLAISIGLLGKTSSETGTTKYLDNVIFLVTLSISLFLVLCSWFVGVLLVCSHF